MRSISLCQVLFVVLFVLKLCHVIKWSWWAITSPLWGSALFLLAVLIFAIFRGAYRQARAESRGFVR